MYSSEQSIFRQHQFSLDIRCCCYDAVNNSDGKSVDLLAHWQVLGNQSIKHNTFPKNWVGWGVKGGGNLPHFPFYLGLPPAGDDQNYSCWKDPVAEGTGRH